MRLTRARIDAGLALAGDALAGVRLAARLNAYFRRPITRDEALAVMRRRYEQRDQTFLAIARRTGFDLRFVRDCAVNTCLFLVTVLNPTARRSRPTAPPAVRGRSPRAQSAGA